MFVIKYWETKVAINLSDLIFSFRSVFIQIRVQLFRTDESGSGRSYDPTLCLIAQKERLFIRK